MDIKREGLARQVLLTGTVSPSQVSDDIEAYYAAHIAPELEIPGFRKGKAPRKLAEKRLGPEMYRPVLDEYFRQLVSSIDDLDAIAHGDFGFAGRLDGNDDVVLTCTVSLPPRVLELDVDAATATVAYAPLPVSADEVEAEVLRRCRPHMLEDIADGDGIFGCASAIIDFRGSANGMPFPGGSASDFEYVAGETDFVPGFAEKLLRMRVGESGQIAVNFPEHYQNERLAGQPALFSVTVKSAKRAKSSTEEAAVSAGFESLAALRAKAEAHFLGVAGYEADRDLRRAVTSALTDAVVCEMLPNEAVDAMAEASWGQFTEKHGLSEREFAAAKPGLAEAAKDAVKSKFGLDVGLDDGDEYQGKLFKALCAEETARAAKAEWKMSKWELLKSEIRTHAALDHVAEQHNLAATEAEVAARIMELFPGSRETLDKLDADAAFRKQAKRTVTREKALDWVVSRVKGRA